MAKVIIPQVAIDSNQTLAGLAINAVTKGATVKAEGDNVVYGITNEKLPMDAAQLVVSVGGDVLDWELFIEIASEDDAVPEGFIGETYEDENGNVQNNTWSTWLKSNNTVYEADGRKFVSTRGHTGKDLPLSELIVVSDSLVILKDLPKNISEE